LGEEAIEKNGTFDARFGVEHWQHRVASTPPSWQKTGSNIGLKRAQHVTKRLQKQLKF
jgi:hypothetical protein